MNNLAQRFDAVAHQYDAAAPLQRQVAHQLVQWAGSVMPSTILDAGCGTGFVSAELAQRWPDAIITALDPAPQMLQQARRKVPKLKIMIGDAATMVFPPQFDMVFSSMMLHWLRQPLEALKHWQNWLKPGGKIFTGLLADGSFQEWHELCRSAGVADGLWPLPPDNFAKDFATRCEVENLMVTYASAQEFLARLKAIGAATPRADYKPMNAGALRRVLEKAPQPFMVSYRVLYIENAPRKV